MIKNKKISAVICEFNPLHKGHKYILNNMAENSAVVCVMSGNFVQRGDFAIVDKWTRAKMALDCGADLVIELPVGISTGNAQTFATGAVEILNSLGIIDELHFGSECGDTINLSKIVDVLKSEEYSNILKDELSSGISFATAREKAISKILGTEYNSELSGSNNNLAIEYMKALDLFNSKIKSVTHKRIGSGHDEIGSSPVVSAMQIRNMINFNDMNFTEKLPSEVYFTLQESIEKKECPCTMSKLELAILYKLRTMSKTEISNLPDISEGLDNKFYKAIRKGTTLDEVIELTKSKRYTHARIRRLILHSFLGVTENMQKNEYVKILAMSETGKEIIKNCNKDLPIVVKYADVKKLSVTAQKLYEFECNCDDIFELSRPIVKNCGRNQTHKIIKN